MARRHMLADVALPKGDGGPDRNGHCRPFNNSASPQSALATPVPEEGGGGLLSSSPPAPLRQPSPPGGPPPTGGGSSWEATAAASTSDMGRRRSQPGRKEPEKSESLAESEPKIPGRSRVVIAVSLTTASGLCSMTVPASSRPQARIALAAAECSSRWTGKGKTATLPGSLGEHGNGCRKDALP